ncbi:DUF5694 domain-containing protein [Pseudoduganella ginsengisoli]|uniref:TraB/GumN family protein n=1 Tax=Pseudoduganella ginsengisoli TaxID=1462440 RepID=A0A6L6Q8T1_9BURK|nr:DUF5694 domain-containing protein [Pseudoduganella ginsengisoli]MTW05578.1 hypothetical protein [Pseudoduganella ginsengisoli]
MQKHWLKHSLLVATLLSTQALAQVDFASLTKDMPGQRSQVLVLGTMHLSGLPKDFKREALAPLLDKLAAFKPDIIAIEAISGEGCDLGLRHPSIYADSVTTFCSDTKAAYQATGLDVPSAIAEMNTLLKNWPAQPAASQRRRMAAIFLAANERASALAQWLQLPESERHESPELPASLVAMLKALAVKQNENYLLGAPLAARLGLARVVPMDDHTGDDVDVPDDQAFWKTVGQAWEGAAGLTQPLRQREDELSAGSDFVPLYRYINRYDVQQVFSAADFGAALKDKSPQQYGRMYVAGWETRNLRMASNIMASFRERPGARVLVIVGAMHKPWLERVLALGHGVDIVDVQAVLK